MSPNLAATRGARLSASCEADLEYDRHGGAGRCAGGDLERVGVLRPCHRRGAAEQVDVRNGPSEPAGGGADPVSFAGTMP